MPSLTVKVWRVLTIGVFTPSWSLTDDVDDELLLEQEVLRHHRSYSPGATELHGHHGEVKQGEQQVPHLRASLGQTPGVAQRCRILNLARELSIRDAQGSCDARSA